MTFPTYRAVLSATLLALVAAGPRIAAAETAAPSGTLRIAIGADAQTLDPAVNSLPVGTTADHLIFDQLFYVNGDSKVVPSLASKWGYSDDGMTFTVTIKTGHMFSNGDKVDAAAVAASFNRLMDPKSGSIYAGLYASLGKAEAQGEDTVVFHLAQKNGHLLMLLANEASGITDVKAAESMGADYGRTPIGSGPYKVADFVAGERFSLVPNPKYQGERPATLEKIAFQAVPEDGSRMALMQTGAADVVDRVPSQSIKAIDGLKDAKVIEPDSMFSINMEVLQRGPMKDLKVRQALNYSLDRAGMVKGILGGLGTPSVGMPGPGTQDDLRVTFKPMPYDPAKAKALLKEAGYGPGHKLQLTLVCPNGRYIKDAQICEALAGSWQAIGIDAKARVMDLSSWSAELRLPYDQRKDNMIMVGRATAGMDFTLYRLFHSGVSANTTDFNDPAVDKLLEEGRATADLDQQKKIYAEIQKKIWDEMPFVFLWYQKQALGLSDKVKGFVIRPDETMLLDHTTVQG